MSLRPRITAILHGQRGVTADTALRLARYFGTTPQVWLNLQKTYELRRAENSFKLLQVSGASNRQGRLESELSKCLNRNANEVQSDFCFLSLRFRSFVGDFISKSEEVL